MTKIILWTMLALIHPARRDPGIARYELIAEAIDQQSASIKEAALLIAVSRHESGDWSLAVHSGKVKGDDGKSWCLMQLMLGRSGSATLGPWRPPNGWHGEDIVGTERITTMRCVATGAAFLRHLRKRVCKIGDGVRCMIATYLGLRSSSRHPEVLARIITYRIALKMLRQLSAPSDNPCVSLF